VFANSGGLLAEVELFPDAPTHDALGLTRVHSGKAEAVLTGSAAAPATGNPSAMGPSVLWRGDADTQWTPLANVSVRLAARDSCCAL
jgi:hypothetical protein